MPTKKKAAPKSLMHPATWRALNDILREADEARCSQLLKDEKTGPKRARFIWRIGCRARRAASIRERAERTQPSA
jgi:hypothetical protein